MYEKFNVELISRVLLLPYLDAEFSKPNGDLLMNLIKAYHNVISSKKMIDIKANNALRKANNAIEHYRFKDVFIPHLDDINMLINMFYPLIELADKTGGIDDKIISCYIDKLFVIASNFITFRDGRAAIRIEPDSHYEDVFHGYKIMNKIELWSCISRLLPTDIFIAAHYINTGILEEQAMQKYYVNAPELVDLSDIPLRRVLSKGVAETHMHFNAGAPYLSSWQHELDIENNRSNTDYLFDAFFRLAFACFIEQKEKDICFDEELTNSFGEERKNTAQILYELINAPVETHKNIVIDHRTDIERELINLKGNYEINEVADVLERTVYKKYKHMNTSGEMIFLFKCLSYFKYDEYGIKDSLAKQLFLKYLRDKNMYYSEKLQSNKIGGLDFFSYHYKNATKRYWDNSYDLYKSVFKEQFKNPGLKKIEVRKGAPIRNFKIRSDEEYNEAAKEIVNDALDVLKAYHDYMSENHKDNDVIPGMGIIYHFFKRKGADNYNGRKCILNTNTSKLYRGDDFYAMRMMYGDFLEALNRAIMKLPVISKYIVGIDAASKEHLTEPWVFAPLFSHARNREQTLPIDPCTKKYIYNYGLTYHVGEDFRHIISGLRHIDEVIEHFGYMSGDRVGHAVALGANVHKIIGVNQMVCMPIMEYLDNLLWMWGTIRESSSSSSVSNLEYKILKTAREIYGEQFYNIDVFMLREAYDKRFLPFTDAQLEMIKSCKALIENTPMGISDFCLFKQDGHIWNSDKLMCTCFCPCYFRLYERPKFVEITHEDADTIEILQRYMIKKIERKGVYVETNPTSNAAITDIGGVMSHPILRLNNSGLTDNPDDEANVLVTVNTDDPNVFATNVENEISLVYHMLVHNGYSREKVLQWTDKIRQNGLDSSFVKSEYTLKELNEDIEKMKSVISM